jgi:hypothetical protein
MSTNRKPLRARRSAPPPPAPTENQLFEAMLAFHTLKMRYRIESIPHAPAGQQFVVRVVPEMMVGDVEFMGAKGLPPVLEGPIPNAAYTIHRFVSEDAARRWREHEIIRETIKVAMRTKP